MTFLEEYHESTRDEQFYVSKGKRIVFAIIRDLTGRQGMDWDQIDYQIQDEILHDLVAIVETELVGFYQRQLQDNS